MTKRKGQIKLSEEQTHAIMCNAALRSFASLRTILQKAGYYNYQQRVKELDEQFRAERKRATK